MTGFLWGAKASFSRIKASLAAAKSTHDSGNNKTLTHNALDFTTTRWQAQCHQRKTAYADTLTTRLRLSQKCLRHTPGKPNRQGRIKGGATGAIAPGPRCKGAPRDEIYLFQIKCSVEKFSWFRSDTRTQLYYIPMFCQVWRAPNNNWFLYIRSGEPNYYRGPHQLCIIAGGPQNQQILS